ncbi:hypothetical protein D3C84_1148600 [compost metagenome]
MQVGHVVLRLATRHHQRIQRYLLHLGHQQGYLATGHATQLIKPVGIELKAKLAGGMLPGGQVQGHGVHQGAVEVEDQALKSG